MSSSLNNLLDHFAQNEFCVCGKYATKKWYSYLDIKQFFFHFFLVMIIIRYKIKQKMRALWHTIQHFQAMTIIIWGHVDNPITPEVITFNKNLFDQGCNCAAILLDIYLVGFIALLLKENEGTATKESSKRSNSRENSILFCHSVFDNLVCAWPKKHARTLYSRYIMQSKDNCFINLFDTDSLLFQQHLVSWKQF